MENYISRPDINRSSSSICGSDSWNSSFSSDESTASWDMVATPSPSRRESCDNFVKIEGLSSSRPSFSCSPADHSEFYPMASLSDDMFMDDQGYSYSIPCNKGIINHGLKYNFQFSEDLFAAIGAQEYIDNQSGIFLDNSPPLVLATPTLSPQNFVNPTQTFIDPYQTSTPLRTPQGPSRNLLASSPMDDIGSSSSQLPYFMSPVEEKCSPQSAHSSRSSYSGMSFGSSGSAMASSIALHRVQEDSKIRKPKKNDKYIGSVLCLPQGSHSCTYPGCKAGKTFRRMEHLKRHIKTHYAVKDLVCPFCDKGFQSDRADNWKSHVKLHGTKKDGTRTKFFEEARNMVAAWEEERQRKKGQAPPAPIATGNARRNALRVGSERF